MRLITNYDDIQWYIMLYYVMSLCIYFDDW